MSMIGKVGTIIWFVTILIQQLFMATIFQLAQTGIKLKIAMVVIMVQILMEISILVIIIADTIIILEQGRRALEQAYLELAIKLQFSFIL